MKQRERAMLYDEIKRDYKKLLDEMEEFRKQLDHLTDRPDLQEIRERDPKNYYAFVTGAFKAMPFVLDLKLMRHKLNYQYYETQLQSHI